MHEDFLHFIWRFQYFNKKELRSTEGEVVNVLQPGNSNEDAGPDFSSSKISIDGIVWHGHTEIHICASDWDSHNHQEDAAYNNVILHVVWDNDKKVFRNDGSLMPTIELKDKVDSAMKERFEVLIQNPQLIPCSLSLKQVSRITQLSMLDKALMERLNNKHKTVNKLFVLRKNDWEETAYTLLAKNFGFKINSNSFLNLSEVLPLKTILRHRGNLFAIEALLFGQAGFLDQPVKEDYFQALKKEYLFLSKKYQLYHKRLSLSQWKFLRLRPANFPSFRIAQLAAILCHHGGLFSLLIAISSPKSLQEAFNLNLSSFWSNHVNFGKVSHHKFHGLGRESINNILINTVVPLQVSYGKYVDQQAYIDNAVQLLQQIPAEKNKITKLWNGLGVFVKHAFDSQASIELYNAYCVPRQCLNCNIGVSIIRKGQPV